MSASKMGQSERVSGILSLMLETSRARRRQSGGDDNLDQIAIGA
jgi:hypothetical protein